MKKWILSILAGIAGAVAGLWFSENFMVSKLFLDGIEVDLSDATAVAWALANPTKSEWMTYLTLGQDIVIMQPGSYWMTVVPVAFSLLSFSIIFFPASLFARQKPEPKSPFVKAIASPKSAPSKKTARLTGETRSGASLRPLEKSSTNGADQQPLAMNGQPAHLNGSPDPEADPETQQDAVPETKQDAAPETPQDAVREETVEVVQEETKESPEQRVEDPVPEELASEDPAPEELAPEEIRVKEPVPEQTEQPAGDPEILEDEIWRTHYDYLDAVRTIFDRLAASGEHMAVDFATRYMADPKGSNLEEIVARILEEEKQRNRFSDNDEVEAAHEAMTEYSEDAVAEFRRVINILGEDVDLNAITQKIRERFPKADNRSSVIDPFQMNESQIICELRGKGFEIIAPAGGPYSVKDCAGSRITKPFNLSALQEFLKEQRL